MTGSEKVIAMRSKRLQSPCGLAAAILLSYRTPAELKAGER